MPEMFRLAIEQLRKIALPAAVAQVIAGCMPTPTSSSILPEMSQTHGSAVTNSREKQAKQPIMPKIEISFVKTDRTSVKDAEKIKASPFYKAIEQLPLTPVQLEAYQKYGWTLFDKLQETDQTGMTDIGDPTYGPMINSRIANEGAKIFIEYEATPSSPLFYDAAGVESVFKQGGVPSVEFMESKEKANLVISVTQTIVINEGLSAVIQKAPEGRFAEYGSAAQQSISMKQVNIDRILSSEYAITAEGRKNIDRTLTTWLLLKALRTATGGRELPVDSKSFMSDQPQLVLKKLADEEIPSADAASADAQEHFRFLIDQAQTSEDAGIALMQIQMELSRRFAR